MNIYGYALARAAVQVAEDIIDADHVGIERGYDALWLFDLAEALITPENPAGPGLGRITRARVKVLTELAMEAKPHKFSTAVSHRVNL